MKKALIVIILISLAFNCFAQVERIVRVSPFIDTAHYEFKEIFNFWVSYMNELNIKNLRSALEINEMDDELKTYWTQNEINTYKFVDLYYAFMSSIGSDMYTFDKEYFLGIAKRDTNLFELKTIFVTEDDSFCKGFPSLMITVPVRKINGTFMLENKFSFTKDQLMKSVFDNIIYYYPPTYNFNDSLAGLLNRRIEEFKKNFQIHNQNTITYLIASNYTEISKWFGIDYYNYDYLSLANTIQGGYINSNMMVLSGGGGENCLHEIIHILLSEFNRGNYNLFEEGIACYFGDHLGKPYSFHTIRFKEFLNKNLWIDLSQSLYGYSKNDAGEIVYRSQSNDSLVTLIRYRDFESIYNFQYMVHVVICDIAFRMGGYKKVKELYLSKAENEQDFYRNIENSLGIKQCDLNKYLRNFINSNY